MKDSSDRWPLFHFFRWVDLPLLGYYRITYTCNMTDDAGWAKYAYSFGATRVTSRFLVFIASPPNGFMIRLVCSLPEANNLVSCGIHSILNKLNNEFAIRSCDSKIVINNMAFYWSIAEHQCRNRNDLTIPVRLKKNQANINVYGSPSWKGIECVQSQTSQNCSSNVKLNSLNMLYQTTLIFIYFSYGV